MAQTVVDIFEPVKIDKQYTDVVVIDVLSLGERCRQPVHKKGPVRQACQGIMCRLVLQLLVGGFFVRYVLDLKDQIGLDRPWIAGGGNAERCPDRSAGLCEIPQFHLAAWDITR